MLRGTIAADQPMVSVGAITLVEDDQGDLMQVRCHACKAEFRHVYLPRTHVARK